MSNYISKTYSFLKEALYSDVIDRSLLIVSILLFLLDWGIWHFYLSDPTLNVYLKLTIYPMAYLAIVFGINLILAVTAHEKDREIGYLLLIGNIICTLLIFALEVFYLNLLP